MPWDCLQCIYRAHEPLTLQWWTSVHGQTARMHASVHMSCGPVWAPCMLLLHSPPYATTCDPEFAAASTLSREGHTWGWVRSLIPSLTSSTHSGSPAGMGGGDSGGGTAGTVGETGCLCAGEGGGEHLGVLAISRAKVYCRSTP